MKSQWKKEKQARGNLIFLFLIKFFLMPGAANLNLIKFIDLWVACDGMCSLFFSFMIRSMSDQQHYVEEEEQEFYFTISHANTYYPVIATSKE